MDTNKILKDEQPPPYDGSFNPAAAYPQPQQPYPQQPQPQQPFPQQPQPQQPFPQQRQPQQQFPQHQQPQAQYGYGYGYPAQQQQTTQNTVVVMSQPTPQPAPVYVQDNMVISIISIFFCCLLGIIATVQASESRDSLRRGDVASAQRLSRSARKLAIAGIVVGSVCAGLSILFSILVPIIVVSSADNSYSYSSSDGY
ncbi:proline-rich transmembrane protein 1 [Plakobranchus ocellatus]|uniref:Proline-rich transmembrane protein 1 n=1 Tax=Plakobranchus ocellatus TaxID=259542 RepID=A0AAV4A2Z3_9GAST|nr:proline-rich transmembrane protein 1 [Plakobranchus ocellatus]